MAIRAKKFYVFRSVVSGVSIFVMDFDRNVPSDRVNFAPTALLALVSAKAD